MKMQIVSVLL